MPATPEVALRSTIARAIALAHRHGDTPLAAELHAALHTVNTLVVERQLLRDVVQAADGIHQALPAPDPTYQAARRALEGDRAAG